MRYEVLVSGPGDAEWSARRAHDAAATGAAKLVGNAPTINGGYGKSDAGAHIAAGHGEPAYLRGFHVPASGLRLPTVDGEPCRPDEAACFEAKGNGGTSVEIEDIEEGPSDEIGGRYQDQPEEKAPRNPGCPPGGPVSAVTVSLPQSGQAQNRAWS